jgi:hypothetical protein
VCFGENQRKKVIIDGLLHAGVRKGELILRIQTGSFLFLRIE